MRHPLLPAFLALAALSLACTPTQRPPDDDGDTTETPDAGDRTTDEPDAGSCRADGDSCSAAAKCCTGLVCSNGSCEPKPVGECTTSSTCTAGLEGGGCCENLPYCIGTSGTKHCSATCGASGLRCAAASDCCDGLSCVGGTCKTATTSCETEACTAGSCCPSAPYCIGAPTGDGNSCSKTCGQSNWTCEANGDCCQGLACTDGVCTSTTNCLGRACGDGVGECCGLSPYCGAVSGDQLGCAKSCFAVSSSCRSNYDCCSGVCSNGTCTSSTSGTEHPNFGRKCHGASDCGDANAGIQCTLFDDSSTYGFCTLTCTDDANCGPHAYCGGDGFCYRDCSASGVTCPVGSICDEFGECLPDCRTATGFCGSYVCNTSTGECE